MTKPMNEPGRSSLEALFAILDRWRNLPAYRLEPRVDPFFAMFLREVIVDHTGVALHEIVVPELPLRRGTIFGEGVSAPNKSVKVDFVLFAEDRTRLFLVELKTDVASRRTEQDRYLELAKTCGARAILQGLLQILEHTNPCYRPKYMALMKLLEAVGCVKLDTIGTAEDARSVGDVLRDAQVVVQEEEFTIDVIFVQPVASGGDHEIGFNRFAAVVERHDDELARLFARYLRSWTHPPGVGVDWS